MRSILASLMVTASLSAQQRETPPLPADLGLTEEEIVATLVPNREELVRAMVTDDRYELDYARENAGRIESWQVSDFGLSGRRYLVVWVGGTRGACAQCAFGRLGVFDLATKGVVFRFEHEGSRPQPSSRVFRLVPGDPVLTLAFQTGRGSLNFGGSWETEEQWYRPVSNSDGIELRKVWSGLVESAEFNNSSMVFWRDCASMSEITGTIQYRRIATVGYGPGKGDSEAEEAAPCGCEDCGVAIRKEQVWEFGADPGAAARLVTEKISRADLAPVDAYPFQLHQRRVDFRRTSRLTPSSYGGDPQAAAQSPSGAWTAQWSTKNILNVVARDGSVKRTVEIPIESAASHDRTAVRMVSSLGWQSDERRVFVILELGVKDRALVSYALDGGKDYWESALSSEGDAWPLGFILERKSKR
jgi:hypothetical protein